MDDKWYKEHWGDTKFICYGCRHEYSMVTAKWVYNDSLKKKTYSCPNCRSRVMIHIPNKEK
ncbi:hypothetical protein F485_gp131 [Aeromonas phage CC2]|uniref:Uncharacterized protein n=1 Tax=Aeromonas phage CC2 TaxID=1204516 RepID=I6WLZ2_9CAUD|nr:hypothetical protein F485_gp131 [Aeromonas phage CC2]AFN39243.1 hypothetical protein CC2_169 [Aeromonas phage CC2]QMV28735.1 hypothetical protein AP1_0017 [Aeromonas phage AP1]